MIQIFSKRNKSDRLKELTQLTKGSWVNLTNPSKKELKWISEKTKIGLDEIKDTVDPNEVPRIEKENNYKHFIIRIPKRHNETKIKTIPLGIFILKDKIVTICSKSNKITDELIQNTPKEFLTNKPEDMLIPLLNSINKHYKYHLKGIHKKITKKEVQIKKLKPNDIVDLVEIEKVLNYFITDLSHTTNVFERLFKAKIIPKKKKTKELVEDIVIDAQQNLENSRTMQKIVMNTRNAYESILGNSLNKIMKFLTAITVILTIPTVVSGIYGMNVDLPLQQNPQAFSFLMIFMIIVSIILAIIFSKKNWL